jgi:hypothetical protein
MGTPRGYRATESHSYAGLERMAASIRIRLGFAATSRLPGVELFERLDSFSVRVEHRRISLDYAVLPELPRGVEAQTRYDATSGKILIELPEAGYRALQREQPHVRFSLLHEIAHAFLHPLLLLRFSGMPEMHVALLRGVNTGHALCDDSEWQADALSAALLMPAAALLEMEKAGTLEEVTIAKECGVSIPAATIRLRIFEERRNALLRYLDAEKR